jgi:hypothetical protein
MRTHVQRLTIASLIACSAALLAAPDLALARGCGGGSGGDGNHHADPQDGGQGQQGPRNRGQRGRGQHGGPNDGHDGPRGRGPRNRGPHGHGPHGPGPRGRGPDVDVRVGGYGYPGARPGPPSPACYELQRAHDVLASLYNLRVQINSGKRIIMPDATGRPVVMSSRAYATRPGDAGSAAELADNQRAMASIRDASLHAVDQRIAETQERIGQLGYDCPD